MKRKLTLFLLNLCIILTLTCTAVYAESAELIEYDVTYTVSTTDNITKMNITFTIFNGETETQQPFLIAAMYDGGKLIDLKTAEPLITSGIGEDEEISITIPNEKTDDYYVRLMVWESKGSLKPLGDSKTVHDIDPYLREKFLYVTANEDLEFKVFMNSLTVKGENGDAVHIIKYDSTKMEPIDLCGFTYEMELAATEVPSAGIIIENFDTANGVIVYKFLNETGRNTGTNNIIRFKALTTITDAEIEYTIQ